MRRGEEHGVAVLLRRSVALRRTVSVALLLSAFGLMAMLALAADPWDIVVVTDDTALPVDGCDAISVFSASSGASWHRGPKTDGGPGRLAAGPGFGQVFAQNCNADFDPGPFLTYLRYDSGSENWTNQGIILGANFASVGGIDVTPDGEWLLVATVGPRPQDIFEDESHPPPYSVLKLAMSEITLVRDGIWNVGPSRGEIVTDSPVAEILATRDGVMHLVTENMVVSTVDVATMQRGAADLQLAPFGIHPPDRPGEHLGGIHATLTPDGRYILVNRWDAEPASINAGDLLERRSWVLEAPSGLAVTGGLSVDPSGSGRLALHGRDKVVITQLSLPDSMQEISRIPVSPIDFDLSGQYGPLLSVAWAGRGDYVVASEGPDQESEFVVFRLDALAGSMTVAHRLDACPASESGNGNDILTGAQSERPPWPWVPSATPDSSPTASVTWTATATPTIAATMTVTATATSTVTRTDTPVGPSETAQATETETPTATSTATQTPVPTFTSAATPTPSQTVVTPTASSTASRTVEPPRRLFMPLALAEVCPPEDVFADVTLVLDASSSMLDPTESGERKIDVAKQAVLEFLHGMRLIPGRDRVALIVFNATAELLQPLTSSQSRLVEALGSIEVRQLSRLDLGIETAAGELVNNSGAGRVRAIVVLSDGIVNPVPSHMAVTAANNARSVGQDVFVVGFGPVMDANVLRAVADPGRYYPAANPGELRAIYGSLTRLVPCPPGIYWGRRVLRNEPVMLMELSP